MSASNDLIERAERETGQGVDANAFDNDEITFLFDALEKEMGDAAQDELDELDDLIYILITGTITGNLKTLLE